MKCSKAVRSLRIAGWQAGSFFTFKLLILAVISANPASAAELDSAIAEGGPPLLRTARRAAQPLLQCENEPRLSCFAVYLEQLSAIQALDSDWIELPAPHFQDRLPPPASVSFPAAPPCGPDAVRGP